jgi:isopentenyl diphosphate isomerase/L-lactate dehydrogenase-like FMN-dependent dehydrogenase
MELINVFDYESLAKERMNPIYWDFYAGGSDDVYMDGGIRRGTGIFKPLALGARAVLIGRPILWGLAVDGARGVQQVLEILHTELERAMKLAGCPTLASINRTLVKWM